jgi:hypothetical protein
MKEEDTDSTPEPSTSSSSPPSSERKFAVHQSFSLESKSGLLHRGTQNSWVGLKLVLAHEFRTGESAGGVRGSAEYHAFLTSAHIPTLHYEEKAFATAYAAHCTLKANLPRKILPATGVLKDNDGTEWFRLLYHIPGKVEIEAAVKKNGTEVTLEVTGKRYPDAGVTTNMFWSGKFQSSVQLPVTVDLTAPPKLGSAQGVYAVDLKLKKMEGSSAVFKFDTILALE